MNETLGGYHSLNYNMGGYSSSASGFSDSSNTLPPQEQAALLRSAFEGSNLATMSSGDWHAKMSQAFGYAPSNTTSPQYAESQKLFENLQKGNWQELGVSIEAVPGRDMESGGVAAFVGGDTATGADDKIVVNEDWLNKAKSGEPQAQKTLNDALMEEAFHAMERKVHDGKSGDVQVDSSGQVKFMEPGTGTGFDEGQFARELLKQPGFHSFEDLKVQSMYEDHGNVYMNGKEISAEYLNLYNPNAHPIDSIANENKNHSVRWRINDQDWDNARINQAFDGPEAFSKIWNHSDNDKDLEGWLNGKNLNGTRNTTEGVTAYVGWVLDQADPVNAPKAQEQKEKLLGEGGLLNHNNNWVNKLSNESITSIAPDLLKNLSVEQLVTMQGSRSGTSSVQATLKLKIAEDPSQLDKLENYFAQSNNGTDFLNKLSDGQIGELNADVLQAIPIEQIQAAKGGRTAAAESALVQHDKAGASTPAATNASQLAGPEIASALKSQLSNPNQELTTGFFDNYFKGALGAEPSGDKANTPREIEIFKAMSGENLYPGWENQIRAAGGEDAVKSFRASELGMDFARWSLRSNENGNGADAATNQAMGKKLSEDLLGESGNNLANMSEVAQQWYLDNWIKPNEELKDYTKTSYAIPAQAVAEAKAANGGKLPEDAGPLIEYFDKYHSETEMEPRLLQKTEHDKSFYSKKLQQFGMTEPPEELRMGYTLENFGNKAPQIPETDAERTQYLKDIFTDLGYSVTTEEVEVDPTYSEEKIYLNGNGLTDRIELYPDYYGATDAAFGNPGNPEHGSGRLIASPLLFEHIEEQMLDGNNEANVSDDPIFRIAFRAAIAGAMVHELSHAKSYQGGYSFNDDNLNMEELAAHWQHDEFLNDWLNQASSDPKISLQLSAYVKRQDPLELFSIHYDEALNNEFQKASEQGVRDKEGYLSLMKKSPET